MKLPFVAALVVGLLAATVAVSCSSNTILPVKEPDKCTLQIVGVSIIASPRINPTENGDPRPVQLRIYQLKTDTRLQNAAFNDIWKDDKKTLQDDFVKVDELPIYPNSRTEVKFERDPSALFIAGVALFRSPKGKSWFTTFELPPAPGKGACGMPKCAGGECADAGPEPPQLNPRFAIWIDGTKIDNGEDHLDDIPDAGRVQELKLKFSGEGSGGGGAASPAPPPAATGAGAKP
jgi:type VI secretion system protein VasD